MQMKLELVPVPVSDVERAIEFYVGTLGFEKRRDLPFGDARWIEVAPPGSATTIALDSPEQVRVSAPLLGHRSFATTERYYNLARAAEAASAWHAVLKGMTQPDPTPSLLGGRPTPVRL